MARKTKTKINVDLASFDQAGAQVIESSLVEEIQSSYGEYGLSIIHSRALPDARDGMKPVHRRVLYSMYEMGLRPTVGYVKSARVVGEVMGKYHPHGDSAIYDTLVRLAQDFSLSVPLVDGHGNFGSPDDGPAASRYTECRLSSEAMLMVDGLDEEAVEFEPNYDGSLEQPVVLPSAFPNLLVNGGSGIAVGMASNMIPHNLVEVIGAARYLIKHPGASLDKLMEFVPGPDLPTGGILLGLDEVRKAYEAGRGIVRMRARVEIGPLEGSRNRQAITAVELPYAVGAEKIIAKIKEEIGKKRLQGIADVKDLTDMNSGGTRLVIECKVGVNPQALLADLYQYTPLQDSFGINNNVLVDGKPQTLGLKPLLEVFLEHRYDVVTRRTRYRLRKATERRHTVEGLLMALDNIDRVVAIIRGSQNTSEARERLVTELTGMRVKLGGVFETRDLDDAQAQVILDMPLRRLVALEVDSLRAEWDELTERIAGFNEILNDEDVLKKVVSDELAAVAKANPTPRRTTLMDGDLKEILAASKPQGPLEIKDDPCQVILSTTGLIARTAAESEEAPEQPGVKPGRSKHDAVRSLVHSTARGQVLLVTSMGRGIKTDVLNLPVLPEQSGTVSLSGMMAVSEIVAGLQPDEKIIGLAPLGDQAAAGAAGLALGTKQGIVKVTAADWPVRADDFEVISLKDGDEVLGAYWLGDAKPKESFVFVTSDASLLRFKADQVRPQGAKGGGMAGIKLAPGQHVVFFGVVRTDDDAHGEPMVVTSTGGGVKVSPFASYPAKGRATGGVRCQRFLAGERNLVVAWVGPRPAASLTNGTPVDLPPQDARRDGSGHAMALGPDLVGHHVERG